MKYMVKRNKGLLFALALLVALSLLLFSQKTYAEDMSSQTIENTMEMVIEDSQAALGGVIQGQSLSPALWVLTIKNPTIWSQPLKDSSSKQVSLNGTYQFFTSSIFIADGTHSSFWYCGVLKREDGTTVSLADYGISTSSEWINYLDVEENITSEDWTERPVLSGKLTDFEQGNATKNQTFFYWHGEPAEVAEFGIRDAKSFEYIIFHDSLNDDSSVIKDNIAYLTSGELNSLSVGEYAYYYSISTNNNRIWDSGNWVGANETSVQDYFYFSVTDRTSTLSIKPDKTSYSIYQGNQCSIGGTITSNNTITSVKATLDGTQYANFNPNSKIVDIGDTSSGRLNSFKGADLSIGTHKIVINASDGVNTVSKTINITVNANTYTVNYNANGGSGAPSSQTKTQGKNLTLSSTKPTRRGYTFQGWATSSTGSVAYASGATYSKDANITLYAVWKANGTVLDQNFFPDSKFLSFVSQFDSDNDGVLSKGEIYAVTEINVPNQGITSLQGIEYFTALTSLDCHGNQLVTLNVASNTSLTSLDCSSNKLTALNVASNTSLTSLNCFSNKLTALNVASNTSLTSLNCSSNQLATLNVAGNTALTSLACSSNQLATLNVASNTLLTSLDCSSNKLTALNVASNTSLTSLNCSSNQLTSLGVSNNKALTTLNCSDNQLTTLNLSNNTALTTLSCSENKLTTLNLTKNTALTKLHCNNNQLITLDLENNTALTRLNCSGNLLTTLNVANNTKLAEIYCYENQLRELNVANNTKLKYLICGNNYLTSLDVANNTSLTQLVCNDNRLTSLTLNTVLANLQCQNNLLASLDLSSCGSRLGTLFCYGNPLPYLNPNSCPTVFEIYLDGERTEEEDYYDIVLVWYFNEKGERMTREEAIAYMESHMSPNIVTITRNLKIGKNTVFSDNPHIHTAAGAVKENEMQATCTTKGEYELVIYCSDCGAELSRTTIETDVLEHNWNSFYTIDKPASCSVTGSQSVHCSACGEIKPGSTQVVATTPHTYGGWTITQKATCTQVGSKVKVCSVCGDRIIETIPANGHIWNDFYTVDKEATKIEEGSKSIHCSVCDEIKEGSVQVIPKQTTVIVGWFQNYGTWYYLKPSGELATGWLKLSNTWYYLDTVTGAMATGWVKDGGTWYYMNSSGAMATGWVKDGNTWYYMNSSGAMQTGWQKINDIWYYLKSSGAMAANEWCGGYWLNANGSWTYTARGSWRKDSYGWWYGDTSGWYAKSETVKIDGNNYIFDARGYWIN